MKSIARRPLLAFALGLAVAAAAFAGSEAWARLECDPGLGDDSTRA